MIENDSQTLHNNAIEQRLDRMVRHVEPSPRFIGQLKDQLVHYYDHNKRYERSFLVIILGALAITTSLILLFWRKPSD